VAIGTDCTGSYKSNDHDGPSMDSEILNIDTIVHKQIYEVSISNTCILHNKTGRQDITEILLKVALNSIRLTPESMVP
jgi:hypothetical protein